MSSRVFGGVYRLLRPLDSGAMGIVYEAEHLRLHRHVAVKVLSSEMEARPDAVHRFRQEAEIMSRLEHPHVVNVLDYDVTDRGESYLVLELLHGETLERRLEREAPLDVAEARSITLQVASALAAAHDASIVHRDLKPSNIFLTERPGEPPFAKLLDFGISKNLSSGARLTQAGFLLGTPEYMAPEQACGRNDVIDARTDQHALALVAYEMLTGIQPFSTGDLAEILGHVTRDEVQPASSVVPWVPAEVDAVLARALAKEPSDRYPDIREFARRFDEALSAVPAEPPVELSSGARSRSFSPASCSATRRLEAVRELLDAGESTEAAAQARAVLDLAEDDADPEVRALVEAAEPLLAKAFLSRLGSPRARLVTVASTGAALPSSPRAAFLSSRIEDGMTVSEVLDVGWMPRVRALGSLVQLVESGALRIEEEARPPSRPAPRAPTPAGLVMMRRS